MSDTPRTDAVLVYKNTFLHGSMLIHARQLERELNESNARLKQLQEVVRIMYDLLPCHCDTQKCQECFVRDHYDYLPDDVKGKVND